MAEVPKVESFHTDGNIRKSSLADPSKEGDRSRRRTSRTGQALEVTLQGPSSPPAPQSSKRLSGNPVPSIRRRSSNAPPPRRGSGTPMLVPRRPKVQVENTYRMEPMVKFRADQALSILREVLERRLRDSKYDAKVCQELARSLAGEIKHKVKDLKVDRYKYVVVVTVGQRQDSELILASRCLLDTKWDTYATYNFENYHVFATGIVYAFYYE